MQYNLKATSPLSEWLSYLENSHFKAIDLGLKRIRHVAETLDLLQPAPFVITVGGTNGKGTTCRLLETILLNAGYRVGVYSSPHLLHYNERVRIQNQDVPDELHTRSFAFIEQHKTESLTYFEFSTLSALYLFKQAKLDIVILEVGLGGRLDATNIIDSHVAVITSIDIDHTDFLGSSREQIGYEKAGIFRANQPVIIGEPNIPASMREYAIALHCQLACRNEHWHFELKQTNWNWSNQQIQLHNLPLCRIPIANAATALAVLPYLPFDLSEQVIRQSLQEVELTGRFQTIETSKLGSLAKTVSKPIEDLPTFIIDVGHNPHAAQYLAEKLTALKSNMTGNIIAVCGILKDKDADGVMKALHSSVDEWVCVGLTGPRGQSSEELRNILIATRPNAKVRIADSVDSGVYIALNNAKQGDIILIFGSFHTVSEFLTLLENPQCK